MAEPDHGSLTTPLRRQLGLVDAVAVVVGIVLGSGIFVAPSSVTAASRGTLGAAGLWIAGGLVATCGGLVYAELGARLPQAGGFFVFYRATYGDAVAFVASRGSGAWPGFAVSPSVDACVRRAIFSLSWAALACLAALSLPIVMPAS